MSIIAVIHFNDGTQQKRLMNGWEELTLWMARHWGEFEGIEAQAVKQEARKNG